MAKMVWQANDGKIFDTEEQADRWDSREKCIGLLARIIETVVDNKFIGDEMAEIIVDNYEEIRDIMDNNYC